MEIPRDRQVTETPSSIYWLDKDGILCSISKKAAPLSLAEAQKLVSELKTMLNGRKVCMLVDITDSGESAKEVRDYAAEEFPEIVRALAVISHSELGKMLANLFFNLKHQPYPTRMFTNLDEAREWLQQFL